MVGERRGGEEEDVRVGRVVGQVVEETLGGGATGPRSDDSKSVWGEVFKCADRSES